MDAEGAIEIDKLIGDSERGEIAANALKAMTDALVELESDGASAHELMSRIVWPIIMEADNRFCKIDAGIEKVELDNFRSFIK